MEDLIMNEDGVCIYRLDKIQSRGSATVDYICLAFFFVFSILTPHWLQKLNYVILFLATSFVVGDENLQLNLESCRKQEFCSSVRVKLGYLRLISK